MLSSTTLKRYQDQAAQDRLATRLHERDIIVTAVMPAAFISPNVPNLALTEILAGVYVEEIAASLDWTGITVDMLKRELRVAQDICDVVAMLLEQCQARCPAAAGGVFIRFLFPRRGGGYATGVVFGDGLVDAMERILCHPELGGEAGRKGACHA